MVKLNQRVLELWIILIKMKEERSFDVNRKYVYWYVITESFDNRYKQYTRLMWKHPKDVDELFTVYNSKTGEHKTLFRLKYICRTNGWEGNKIPEDILSYVEEQWKQNGYPEPPDE